MKVAGLARATKVAFSVFLLLTANISAAQDIDLANLGDRGFRIDGNLGGDKLGWSVSGAGDVNGDGLDDVIVGAFDADSGGASNAGESYVVFGRTDSTPVDVAELGNGGFRIGGLGVQDWSGYSVSGAGDVNGDGLDDVIVGAPGQDFRPDFAGESYVVFGKTTSAPVDLGNLGSGGFRIDGIDADDRAGFSVSGAGDVNGDGLADVIIGAPWADPAGELTPVFFGGESYVVFGKTSSTPVNLAELGAGGFQIIGANLFEKSGSSVSGAGDVNGDGLPGLVIGAPESAAGRS